MRRNMLVLMIATSLLYLAMAPAALAGGKRAARTAMTIGSFDHDGEMTTLKKPRVFTVNSSDSYITFYRLRWHAWGARQAVAHGREKTCFEFTGCHLHATKLVAGRRHGCFGEYWNYWRLTAFGVVAWGKGPLRIPVEQFPCEKPLLPGQA